tara:strand:- start:1114 stop:1527 length:414 start_codon:yes stop_codon:yes gene_type:complete
MKLSFTGTRQGMNDRQKAQLRCRLERGDVEVLIHGDCIGADKDADDIAIALGITRHIYPSDIPLTRAHCAQRGAVNMEPPGAPLDRNIVIAHRGDELFAASGHTVEQVRSGTWHCVRTARKFGRPVTVAWPDRSESS